MSSRPRSLLALAALLAASLVGCADDPPHDAGPPPHDVVKAITRALDSRARVVRRADAAAFGRLVAGGRDFRAHERTWFDNVTQLPVATLRYRLDPGSLVRDGDSYTVTADEVLQLDGYDDAPVTSPVEFGLRPAARHPGRFLVTAVTPAEPQPWDLGPVRVEQGNGVLGVFDAGSLDDAPALLASVESAIVTVSAQVPYDWSRSVVLYALSDPAFLDGLRDVPGDDPEALDAVAFPVGGSTRFALNPRMLDHPGRELDRLVRHELTHVAVGTRDDDVPVWLSEGLAEYVSVRPLPPQDRRIPEAAVAAAEDGAADLPDDASFNDQDSEAHYGLAWWAVEYVADAYGEDAPWLMLDAMDQPGADPDTVLRDQFGTSTRQLAEHADQLILQLYEPAG
ncbi:hypothetical protein [Nocardioides aquiterrae]|uniref:Peptidase MA-like domain-containing protein n=1 Tax=Nocardioides aquiterrae TaxID=203799 RepID=A0ABN1UHD6_9ACTN